MTPVIIHAEDDDGTWFERRVKGAVPRVGERIDDGGQYYLTVVGVYWRYEGFFWTRIVPVVVCAMHDRAEEGYP